MTKRIVHWARIVYPVVAWLFVIAVIFQVFLVGLSLFVSATNWSAHKEFGYSLGFLVLLLVALAVAGRVPRATGRWLALLFVVYAIQTILPNLRRDLPWVAALHPVNALVILWVALTHARQARVGQTLTQPGDSAGQAAQRRPVKA